LSQLPLPSRFPSLRFLLLAATTVVTLAISGCSGSEVGTPASSTAPGLAAPTASSTTSPSAGTDAEPADYRRLLLAAADISDAEDTFIQRSQESRPNGNAGASAFFVNEKDNRAISDTFLVYPDAATASATLHQASATLTTLVAGGTPTPVPVGTDGVMISGRHPEEDKAVTLVFFTEGPALVRLQFQSATGDATTDDFVTSVAKMQQIALRVGLSGPPD
jgi:hypothetical protein